MKTAVPTSFLVRFHAALLAAACLAFASGGELKDLVLSGGKSPSLKLVFSEGDQGSDFPLYFQKREPSSQSITICFLETPTSLPLGKLPLSADAPVPGLSLKKVTTPSGKNFLGVEVSFASLPDADLVLSPNGRQTLKVNLPVSGTAKSNWSAMKELAKMEKLAATETTKEPDVQPAAPIQAAPEASAPKEAPTQPAGKAPETVADVPNSNSTSPAPEAVAPQLGEPGEISDITVDVSTHQEDLVVVGLGLSQDFSFKRLEKDSLAYELRIPNAKLVLAAKTYTPPTGSQIASVKARKEVDGALLQIRLRRGLPAQAAMADGKLSVTLPHSSAVALKWVASANKMVAVSGMLETTLSAHSEGEALDRNAQGLSSSKVFLPTGSSKPMILMRDSSTLKSKPQLKSTPVKTLPAGAQLFKIDQNASWIRVVSEQDTGWIPKKDALYTDEMTGKDEVRLQKMIAARQRAIEIQQQKEAAALAKAAEKEAAAQAKLAEAQAKAEAKAQAEAAKAQAKADAEAAKAQAKADAEAAKAQANSVAEQKEAPQVSANSETVKSPSAEVTVAAQPQATAPLNIATNDEQKLAQLSDSTLRNRLEQERLTAEKDRHQGEEPGPVTYNSFGRRDPFIPVQEGTSDNGIDIDQMRVVGIVWHPSDPMAVLQHVKEASVSFTVKQGDPVHNGRVSRITRDAVTFDITEYGISRAYSLKLVNMQERAKK